MAELDYHDVEMVAHSDIGSFDLQSGSLLERLLFNNRIIFLALCAIVTVVLGIKAAEVRVNADFNQTIPTHQPFIENYLNHYNELQAQANSVQIAVTANHGSIIDPHYLATLRSINDQVYLLPGVNRSFMTSLWTPNTTWFQVTVDGIAGGPVIGQSYDGSVRALENVRQNIFRTGELGQLVSADLKSSMITVPLLEADDLTGKPLDYGYLARTLNGIRHQYAAQGVTLHIIGFAMIVGDMINGIATVLEFFAVSICIAAAFLFWYTRCLRSTFLVVFASLIAVVWQMGILSLLGFDLTPYSVLVPFLIFTIGTSHGAQKMNGVMQDIGRGTHPLVAARYTFRRLFLAGFAALVCDMTSFAALMTIQIEAIRQLAMIASIGVGILVLTNLMMLPTMLSVTGVNKPAATRSLESEEGTNQPGKRHFIWNFLDRFTRRRYATAAIMAVAIVAAIGAWVGRNVQVGDLNAGAPELRQDSQYNRDDAYIVNHFAAGSDSFIVFSDTQPGNCEEFDLMKTLNDLEWRLKQLPIVQSTSSGASFSAYASMLMTEGAPKWYGIEPDQESLNQVVPLLPSKLTNLTCSFAPLYISLIDHKAKTLNEIVGTVQQFIKDPANQSSDFKLSLAGGNAGIDAATNIVVESANHNILLLVYGVVILFCFIAFRSWRAVLCAVVPLALTSILAQALMVWLGIGVKVATLPVVALGVGIGVDYALYVMSIMLKHLRQGASLSQAYMRTLLFTGRVVILTGVTLAAGVVTWIFAPIKFQADMGVLLGFMFILNMLGAMILLPALSYFLLPPRLFANLKISHSGSKHDPT